MSMSIVLLSFTAVVTLLAGGYLFGARRGKTAREELRRELNRQMMHVRSREEASAIQAELRQIIAPVLARNRENQKAQERIEKLLRPVMERERLGQELSQFMLEATTSRGLVDVLDTVAAKGGFRSVMVSDGSGLPLAASKASANPEIMAGTSSFFMILAERIPRHGMPAPVCFVIYDRSGSVTLHRIFEVKERRYLLTIENADRRITPDVFDATVSKIQSLLGR